jgi:hypothetical protein
MKPGEEWGSAGVNLAIPSGIKGVVLEYVLTENLQLDRSLDSQTPSRSSHSNNMGCRLTGGYPGFYASASQVPTQPLG